MAQSRETSLLIAVSGLGIGLLIFLWNMADMMKGDMTYEPSPGPFVALGISACVAYGAVVAGPIGRALAKRLLGPEEGQNSAALEEMRMTLQEVQAELAETHERLDFAERMLAQSRAPDQLPRR
jgi:hypothetical protein